MMSKPNQLWSQFGAPGTMCKPGSMCASHYSTQNSTHMQQPNNIASVYGMLYDQNLRQETSRSQASSSSHIGNGSTAYLPSQQVPLPAAMPISQQGYVSLPFTPYSLPLPHNFIHRPVAHLDPHNYQYIQGSSNYGSSSSSSRRVTPYQRTVRSERRRPQDSLRRGFEIMRPELDSTGRRSSVPLRNIMEPMGTISAQPGIPQTPAGVSVGAANGNMTVRQFLSSWRDRDEELPDRAGVGQNESYSLSPLSLTTQVTSSLNPPPSQGDGSSSYMSSNTNQESSWLSEERRIDRISNPDMLPLMYPIPQLQQIQPSVPTHLPQPESVQQLSQNQVGSSSGLSHHWQCLELQSQQCYSGNANTEYRSDETRPTTMQSQRLYNISSSLETGEIFDDINGTRDSRHRTSALSSTSHPYSSRTNNNVYPNEEQRHWDSGLHSSSSINFPSLNSSENVGSHSSSSSGLVNVGFYDSFCQDPSSLTGTLRNEITPPAHPDTTTRDPQENPTGHVTERPLSSEEINLSLAQADTVAASQQLCFPQNSSCDDNHMNIPLQAQPHTEEQDVSKIDHQIRNDISIESSIRGPVKDSLLIENDEDDDDDDDDDGKLTTNTDDILTKNDSADEGRLISPPTITHDNTAENERNSHSSSVSSAAHSLNEIPTVDEGTHLPSLSYSDHSQHFENMTTPPEEMILSCTDCDQEEDLTSDVYRICGNYDEPASEQNLVMPNLLHTLKNSPSDNVVSEEVVSQVYENNNECETNKNTETPIKSDVSTFSPMNVIPEDRKDAVDIKEEAGYNLLKPEINDPFIETSSCITCSSEDENEDKKCTHQESPKSPPNKKQNFDDNDEAEIHHCVLCGQSFTTHDEMVKHEQSLMHRRLELIQRRAYHRAYHKATGSYDPNVPKLTPTDHEFLVHIPYLSGFRNYYHHEHNFTDID